MEAELRALLVGASLGEWRAEYASPGWRVVARGGEVEVASFGAGAQPERDARAAAAAVNAVPVLLAECARLRRELADARQSGDDDGDES